MSHPKSSSDVVKYVAIFSRSDYEDLERIAQENECTKIDTLREAWRVYRTIRQMGKAGYRLYYATGDNPTRKIELLLMGQTGLIMGSFLSKPAEEKK